MNNTLVQSLPIPNILEFSRSSCKSKVLFLLPRQHYSRSIFSWGALLWRVLYGDVMRYESAHASHVFHFSHGHLCLTAFPSSIRRFRIENLVIWRTITSLALGIIWKARCDFVFNNAHIHLRTMLIEFWMLFVHTIRGQYDDVRFDLMSSKSFYVIFN